MVSCCYARACLVGRAISPSARQLVGSSARQCIGVLIRCGLVDDTFLRLFDVRFFLSFYTPLSNLFLIKVR